MPTGNIYEDYYIEVDQPIISVITVEYKICGIELSLFYFIIFLRETFISYTNKRIKDKQKYQKYYGQKASTPSSQYLSTSQERNQHAKKN